DIRAQRMLCAEIILTYTHEFGNLAPIDPWLDRLYQLLAHSDHFLLPAVELHVRTACLFALDYRQPDPERLTTCVARIEELLASDVPPDLAAMAAGILVMHLYVMADLSACARVVEKTRKLLDAGKLSPVGQGLGWMQLGHAKLRTGDAETAQQF